MRKTCLQIQEQIFGAQGGQPPQVALLEGVVEVDEDRIRFFPEGFEVEGPNCFFGGRGWRGCVSIYVCTTKCTYFYVQYNASTHTHTKQPNARTHLTCRRMWPKETPELSLDLTPSIFVRRAVMWVMIWGGVCVS